MAHVMPENKTVIELEDILLTVFNQYAEYVDFLKMVLLFSNDSFYKLHFIAVAYLNDPYINDGLWNTRINK